MATPAHNVGARIRDLRTIQGMTLQALADKVAAVRGEPVHFTTIAKIERAQRPASLEWVWDIAKALDVYPQELLELPPVKPIRNVPVIGRIAAGNWKEAIEDATETLPVPEGEVGPNAFALRADGDSMDLIFPDGSYVVVDPDRRELLDGKYFAIMNGEGETTFKRFRADPMRLEPQSSNPAHKPIPIGDVPFTVVGRVVMHIQKF